MGKPVHKFSSINHKFNKPSISHKLDLKPSINPKLHFKPGINHRLNFNPERSTRHLFQLNQLLSGINLMFSPRYNHQSKLKFSQSKLKRSRRVNLSQLELRIY